MKKSNRVPFIILIIIHTSLLGYTFYKKNNHKELLVLLLSNIGFAYLFEYIILNLFQAYRYKPGFFRNKYFDTTFGAILSQAIYIPFTAVFITAFQYGWKVKLFFVGYFWAIEKLFIKIGVFKTNWWKTEYSAPLLPVYFMISNRWYKHLKLGTPSIIYLSMFHMLIVVKSNFLYVLAILKKLRFRLGSYHSWRAHFILAPLYTIVCSIITVFFIKKQDRTGKIKAASFMLVLDWLLKKLGLVKINFSIGYPNMLFHLFIYELASKYRELLYSVAKNKHI